MTEIDEPVAGGIEAFPCGSFSIHF
jgi:hypothetical protein